MALTDFGKTGLTQKRDLGTVSGLQQQAEEVGLGQQAGQVLSQKGEDPEQIFSGGFISDVFDTLNLLQHGVTGLIKGKSFSEGVKTRESFTKKDSLGEFGLPGVIGGIALDIGVDPLTYVGGLGLVGKVSKLGKVQSAVKTSKKVAQLVPGVKTLGDRLGSLFIYRFGQDEVYKKMAERTIKNISVGTQNVLDIARPITKLNAKHQQAIAEARKAGKLDDLPKDLLDSAKPAFDELDKLGREAVDLGLLSAETYAENVGKYIARLYRSKEVPEGVVSKIRTFFDKKPVRIDVSRFKKRQDIPEDVRDAMGEILEAGYPTAKALIQLTQANERARFFKEVTNKFSSLEPIEGLVKMGDSKTLGDLAGKFVPKPIADDINEMVRVRTPAQQLGGKIMGGFKFGKVILNPATHARNIVSNFILNDFEGLSPARLDIYARAAKQIATKGDMYKEAKAAGLGIDTFASAELKALLSGPDASKIKSSIKNAGNKIADFYQKEEEFAKMAQYIFQRSKGLNPEEALGVAEKATFNYAQVTPFIRKVRESIFGFPFVTFTAKVTPQVAKTITTKPGKISKIGKVKNAIENQSDLRELQQERASEPSWVRDGFYIKLPMKDKHNRSAYFDLTYILPFGDLISGQLFTRDIERDTGLKEGLPASLLQKTPALNLIKELGRNQDFFGNRIWRDSDDTEKQLRDVFMHVARTYLPPLVADQIPGGYRKDGTRREPKFRKIGDKTIESGGKQNRTLLQELMRQVGIKINPVDLELQESFMEREKEKALETLLLESGNVAEFSRLFVPKEDKKKGITSFSQ